MPHPSRLAPAAVALGCAGLALRLPGADSALVVTVAAGLIGLVTPTAPHTAGAATSGTTSHWLMAVAIGTSAFIPARALGMSAPGLPLTVHTLTVIAVIAVTEEVFFRGLAYGWLAQWGTTTAVVGSAALFTIIHLPAYGLSTFALNGAVGLLFGWQRWSTGGWSAPAITHALANLLILM
jgi:membrane protease YdiL (CAAX protease family)